MIWQPASARYASRIAEISSAGTRRASIFMGRLYRSWRVRPTAEGCAGILDRGSVGSKPAPFWEAKNAAPGKSTARAKAAGLRPPLQVVFFQFARDDTLRRFPGGAIVCCSCWGSYEFETHVGKCVADFWDAVDRAPFRGRGSACGRDAERVGDRSDLQHAGVFVHHSGQLDF